MTEDELAFYDALGTNDSAVKVLGDVTLRKIALELTQMIRNSVNINKQLEHQAQLAYDNGNYTGSLFYLKYLLKIQPNNVHILTDIGSTLNELGNYSGAILYHKEALSVNRHNLGSLVGLGYGLEKLGNKSHAQSYYKEAIKQPAINNFSLIEKAIAFYHLLNYPQALDIINHMPSNIYTMNVKSIILFKMKDYTGAITLFNKSSIEYPKNEDSIYNKAVALLYLGGLQMKTRIHIGVTNIEEGLKNLNMALKINPSDKDALKLKSATTEFLAKNKWATIQR